MILLPDGYIRRRTSTIPFGYEESDIEGYLKPIPEQLKNLKEVADMVAKEQISLGVAVDCNAHRCRFFFCIANK